MNSSLYICTKHNQLFSNIYSMQYAENKIKTANIQMHIFFYTFVLLEVLVTSLQSIHH